MLVVEDDGDLRAMLVDALHDRGFAALAAGNGIDALGMLEHVRPDAILLDLMMPGMDGFEFLAARAERPDLVGIPVVIASAAPPQREVALSTWSALLVKPYDLQTAVTTLERVAAGAQRRLR